MPDPSLTSAQNVSSELGKSTTTTLSLNWANTRNVACISSGQTSLGECRWGINFPGGYSFYEMLDDLSVFDTGLLPNYDTEQFTTYGGVAANGNALGIQANRTLLYDPPFTTDAQATAQLQFLANGKLFIYADSNTSVRTWLTSGANTDYTANLNVKSGTVSAGSSAIDTDLSLDTNRTWIVTASRSGGVGFQEKQVTANLIIKSGGTTLIERPVHFYSYAALGV